MKCVILTTLFLLVQKTSTHVELLSGVLYHGPQKCWQCLSCLFGREARAAKAISNELKDPKANDFTEQEATTRHAFTIDGDGKLR
jgi:hypothetical protein